MTETLRAWKEEKNIFFEYAGAIFKVKQANAIKKI